MQFQDFQALLLRKLQLDDTANTDSFLIGNWRAAHAGEVVIEAMETWVMHIDIRLHKAVKGSNTYIMLIEQRYCTFEEWKLLFNTQITKELFSAFRVFEYFMLNDEQERNIYIANKQPDVTDYIQALLASKSEIATFFWRGMPFKLSLHDLKRHVHFVAKSGEGKTEILKALLYNLQRTSQTKHQHSCVLIEPHGDFAEQASKFHLNKAQKERLLYIDPYLDEAQNHVPILNPFDMLPISTEQDVDTLTQQLVIAFGEISTDTDFSDRMKSILRATIATLLRRPNSTFLDLMDFMQNDPNLIELGKQSPNVIHRQLFSGPYTSGDYENTKKAIYSKLYGLLSTAGFANVVLGKSTIDLQEAMDKGKIIIINLSKGKLGDEASQALGCFVVALLRAITFTRAQVAEHLRKPCFLFIDEMQNYLSPSMEVILSESRKYGLHLVLAHQYLTQVENKRLKDSILSNTATKIVGETNEATIKTMATEMRTDPELIKNMPKYHFTIKAGRRDAIVIKSSDYLLYDRKKPSHYYLNEDEHQQLKDWILYESGYYAYKNNPRLEEDTTFPQNAPQQNHFSGTSNDLNQKNSIAPKPKFSI